MATEKTELEWPYSPYDFFEVPYRRQTDDYVLIADGGMLRITLRTACDPIDADLQNRITKEVEDLFLVRQLLVHRIFELESMRVYQHHPDGKKSISVSVGGVLALG